MHPYRSRVVGGFTSGVFLWYSGYVMSNRVELYILYSTHKKSLSLHV